MQSAVKLTCRASYLPYFLFLPPSPSFLVSLPLLLLLSGSKCLHFLQQTASRGTRVYFATCGDGSLPRQELATSCCWSLTCVHPFSSTVVCSSLLSPPKTHKVFLLFKGHVEAFDMCFIGLQGAIGALFENVRKGNGCQGLLTFQHKNNATCSVQAHSICNFTLLCRKCILPIWNHHFFQPLWPHNHLLSFRLFIMQI